ncbi:MAG: HD-GYP domain-containing protein, partial [bacterium]
QEEHLATIAALCSAQDASDRYTYGHSERVSQFAEKIARQLKLPDKEVQTIRHAGQLHDIGKIGIDYGIIRKIGPLNLREWAEIKRHPAIGAEILKNLKFLKEATPYVELHHERLDGGGYPTGKSADEIPLGARIIKVSDAFDAMTSERTYRPAMTIEEAVEQLRKDSGDQYDPRVVEALVELISRGEIDIKREPIHGMMRKLPWEAVG